VNSADLIKEFEAIWRLTQKMREAANQGEWDQLIELEQTRAALTDALMKQDGEGKWGREEQVQKDELIRKILAADDEIKSLTESWMGELQEMLGSIGIEKKLSKAYESS
jgi:flagellar protein FliT